jgi:hypothetical protein
MKEHRGRWLGCLAMTLVCCLGTRAPAAPWDKILTMSRVEADPKKPYTLSEKNGPWMIMACSFSAGEDDQGRQTARQQAHELVLEIRKRYKLPAYVYEKTFEFGKNVQGRGVDRFGNPLKMKHQRGTETQEVAVLVGDYPKADDAEAQQTLKKLKQYQPDCLSLEKRPSTSRTLAALRTIQKEILPEGNEKKKKGPMGHAFVTTNPLLPAEFFTTKGIDDLVLKANEGVEHCLLDCPGKFTVQVAHFTGKWIMKQNEIEAIENGKPMESKLVEATEKAHFMVQTLRKHGFDAYEFHDRYASVVTVGSFDSLGQRDADGVLHMDARIKAVIQKFQGSSQAPSGGAPIMLPKTLRHLAPEVSNQDNIPFAVQPIPVEVPKRPIAATISRRTADSRY